MKPYRLSWFRAYWKHLVVLLVLVAGPIVMAITARNRHPDAASKRDALHGADRTNPFVRIDHKKALAVPAATDESKQLLSRYSFPVKVLAFSPDGRRLATAARNTRRPYRGEIRVWDLVSGREECGCQEFPSTIYSLAFSPDGQLLATSDSYACIKLWQMSTRQQKCILRQPTVIVQGLTAPGQKQATTGALAFDPEGGILASSTIFTTFSEKHYVDEGIVQLWDVATGKEITLSH